MILKGSRNTLLTYMHTKIQQKETQCANDVIHSSYKAMRHLHNNQM
jgi:hypothetical protein